MASRFSRTSHWSNTKMRIIIVAITIVLAFIVSLFFRVPVRAETFMVPYGVSAGFMNMRNGPGTYHAIVGRIPQGELVDVSKCRPRDDGIVGSDWCLVVFHGRMGWVSRAGLEPYTTDRADGGVNEQPVQPARKGSGDYYRSGYWSV